LFSNIDVWRMQRSFIFALLIAAGGFSRAQSVLPLLHPQPRAAYARLDAEALSLKAMRRILLDPDSAAWAGAAQLNLGLRARGLDTMAVAPWTSEDSTVGCVVLGVRSAFINRLFDRKRDQHTEATATYPGSEGSVLDIASSGMLCNASDARGLRYGIETFLQLLDLRFPIGGIEACRIVDAPEFPERWFLYESHFDDAGDAQKARSVWDRALRSKLNAVAFADWWHLARISSMPQSYRDSLGALRDFARTRELDIIPFVMPFGGSNTFLHNDPNLASGLPVKSQRFLIEGDTARLLPRIPVSIPNGSFETHQGNVFPGFEWVDRPGEVSFADTAVRHSGACSIRFENIGQYSPEWGHGRFLVVLPVTPFTQFHVRAWVKTEAFVPSDLLRMLVMDMRGRELFFNELRIPASTDWMLLDFTFNSLYADSLMLWSGSWQGRTGRVWWDDFSIEEVAGVNLLRRPGTPVTLMSPSGSRRYTEGVDVDSLLDPLMASMYAPGVYSSWHTPPTFRIRAGGALRNGDTVLASYCHAQNIYGDFGQVTATMSDERTYALIERETAVVDSIFHPRRWFMHHDEIRMMNWDDGDLARGLSPAAILADNVRRCMDILHRLTPAADIWDWSDMFDEYHNAVDAYYLVNGSLVGGADKLPRSLGIVNWNGQAEVAQKSVSFFAGKGFRQISAPYYDTDPNNIRVWKEWTRGAPGFEGMMYTTWKSEYRDLEPFAEYAWNHAPYIYHTPATALQRDGSLRVRYRAEGDRADSAWQLAAVLLWYRTSPGAPFSSRSLTARTGALDSTDVPLPPASAWVQWYLTAIDNRGWITKVPFGDSSVYEAGDISTGMSAIGEPAFLAVHGLYPDPLPVHGECMLDWSATKYSVARLSVTDLLGRVRYASIIKTGSSGVQHTRLALPELPAGIYVLRLASDRGSASRTFRKM
jgi:hypothetical protein